VVGDQRPFVAAMLALDQDELDEWAGEQGLAGVGLPDLLSHDILRAELQGAVDEANRSVSKAESIRTFVVLPRDLSIDSGELTPTLKVRRMVVAKTYGSVIEEMYG
jgi:long-chain acyl-CoA synthetase